MYTKFKDYYESILDDIKEQGLWKEERIVSTPQSSIINTTTNKNLLNFKSNQKESYPYT